MSDIKLVYLDTSGELATDESLIAMGRSWDELWEMTGEDMIPLPQGSDLMYLPQRAAVGLEPRRGRTVTISDENDSPLVAVAAILPAGYTRTYLPAYEAADGDYLPLFGYTAVGAIDGTLYAAAVKTDEPHKWNPLNYNDATLPERVREKTESLPGNRIVEQLAYCALEYHCLTAQNFFYERWEAGLPTSPACNAGCIGCISLQESGCCPSPQQRIDFVPSLDEIVAVAVSHLEKAPDGIISFGQGCEGEPLLQAPLLTDAVRVIRHKTQKGTINMNTNASSWRAVKELAGAGLDSLRVSLISARTETYEQYHRPNGYSVADVQKALVCAKEYGVYTSLNLLVFPGLTDVPKEAEALFDLVNSVGVDLVQLRNLNIDPDLLMSFVSKPQGEPMGIRGFIEELRKQCPNTQLGNFSRPLKS